MSEFAEQRPEHTIHHSSQPLPGVGGQPAAVDYSVGALDRQPTPQGGWDHTHDHESGMKAKTHHVEQTAMSHVPGHHEPALEKQHDRAPGERPMGVSNVPEGGVAVGGQEGLPMRKASVTDKLVGKTEKVIGKLTRNANLHEKGELREAGGNAAETGNARTPHY